LTTPFFNLLVVSSLFWSVFIGQLSKAHLFSRLETMVLMAGTELPSRAVREQIVSAIHLLVQVRRYDDGVRRIESIAEITGLEGLTPLMQELFTFHRRGRQGRKIVGHFSATGVVPRMVEELRETGVQIPAALFQRSGEPEP
jgi:pilus assembly protein CpaF